MVVRVYLTLCWFGEVLAGLILTNNVVSGVFPKQTSPRVRQLLGIVIMTPRHLYVKRAKEEVLPFKVVFVELLMS